LEDTALADAALFFWVMGTALVTVYASRKNLAGFWFFLLSVAFSPLVGFVAAAYCAARKQCPACKKYVRREATACPYCRTNL